MKLKRGKPVRKKFINLLPPEEQSEMRRQRLHNRVLNFGVWVMIVLVAATVGLWTMRFALQGDLDASSVALSAASQELQSLQNTPLREEVLALNRDLSNLDILQNKHQEWSLILRELAGLLPRDVTLDKVSITRNTRKLEIVGHALRRESVLQFRESLINSPYFTNVNFPLANLEKPQDLEWSYRLYFRCGKESIKCD